jgi:PilZ domain-containing protein
MMARIEARWEDDTGTSHVSPGKLEDMSEGGLGIRVNDPIRVGSKVVVQWRQESISGTVVQCRQIGQNYLLGMKRDAVKKSEDN